jgi:succinate dehydrogenase / fumarate reductase iron-sulfur subunit
MSRTLTLHIRRTHGWADYTVIVPEGAYVLDALEAAEHQDATLLFRHACHHASCGSCGLRVNGRERLACLTRVVEVARRGRVVKLEPLRNLPLLGDLLVDHQPLFSRIDEIGLPPIRAAESDAAASTRPTRFENCIECGLCVSACPVAGSDPRYWGPAALAAAARVVAEPRGRDATAVLRLMDDEHGLWRCHGAFECTEVCPADVDPAGLIMKLRQRLLKVEPR